MQNSEVPGEMHGCADKEKKLPEWEGDTKNLSEKQICTTGSLRSLCLAAR
jgi:hypothetical protein